METRPELLLGSSHTVPETLLARADEVIE